MYVKERRKPADRMGCLSATNKEFQMIQNKITGRIDFDGLSKLPQDERYDGSGVEDDAKLGTMKECQTIMKQ